MAVNVVHLGVLGLCIWGISGEKVWPCQNPSQNYTCVGEYLNKYSECSLNLIGDRNLDPHYYTGILNVSTPVLNTTEQRTNLTVIGVSKAYLKDFFYNNSSRKAVLTVFYPYLRMTGITTINFQVPEDEGVRVTSNYDVTYTDVTLTTVFNDYTDMRLENSETSAYVPNLPTYIIGDPLKAAAANNERVANAVAALAENTKAATLESFASRGWALVRFFVDYRLCDYDPEVTYEDTENDNVYKVDYIYTQ